MSRAAVAFVVLAACGAAGSRPAASRATPVRATTGTDRIVALLPDGAQLVIELDLARLRKNAVVGGVASRALAQLGGDTHVPGLPLAVQGMPIAAADAIVIAAYGVGTAQSATIAVVQIATDIPGATRLGPDLLALGPDDWMHQIQARAAIAAKSPLAIGDELAHLRDHAMPAEAPGATLRITARLPFDARVAIARSTGLDAPPGRISVWGDVADDIAIVIDADAADPGDRGGKDAARRLAGTLRTTLAAVADMAIVRSLGVPNSLTAARLVSQGSWVRAIIVVDPPHLARVVDRANAMLGGA